MYQFPDSTSSETTPPHQEATSLTTSNKKKHFKAILIANVLLALFVAIIVWFLFFFNSNTSPSISKLPITQKNTQKLSESFTPTTTKNNQASNTNNAAKINDSQTVIKEVVTEQKNKKSEVKTTLENVPNTNKQPEKISAIDAITKELEKNQSKTKTTPPKPSLSHGRSLKKEELSEKNQVVIEKTTNTLLENILTETTKNLSNSEHALVEQLEKATYPSNTIENKEEKTSNSDIHNSVSLQKSKDIDKIMAAMGSIKKPSLTTTIENKVKYLLTTEKDKYRKTDQYERKLEPEAKLNSNEMRILTVKKGEAIWDIAVRAYGDGNKYKKILDANPLIKENPSLLKAGVTLRVPL